MEKTAAAPFKMMIMCWKGCKCSWSRRRSEAISSSQRWETPISNSNNNNNNMMIIICKSTSPIMHPKKNLNNLPFKFQETAMPTKKKRKKTFLACLVVACSCGVHLHMQGGWEDDESIGEAACREAFEEAGVKGVLSVGDPSLMCHLCLNNCKLVVN